MTGGVFLCVTFYFIFLLVLLYWCDDFIDYSEIFLNTLYKNREFMDNELKYTHLHVTDNTRMGTHPLSASFYFIYCGNSMVV